MVVVDASTIGYSLKIDDQSDLTPKSNLPSNVDRYHVNKETLLVAKVTDENAAVDFPDFSRPLIISKQELSRLYEGCPIYSRI